MALKLKNLFAYELLDSRGFPTVAVIAQVGAGFFKKKSAFAKAIVPSGASTGEREALELRDNDLSRYHGKGVKTAVNNINDLVAKPLVKANLNIVDQQKLDKWLIDLDGTENKSRLGANAILAVSLAIAKAVAKFYNIPFYRYVGELFEGSQSAYESKFTLPLPMVNVINGGEHADNTIDFQEFMFMPIGAKSMHEAVRISSECFHSLQKLLHKRGYNTNKGDEGGFAPNLTSAHEALTLMSQAVVNAGFTPGVVSGNVAFALDCAASELYDKDKGVYVFKKALAAGLLSQKKATKTTDQMISYLKSLVDEFPIVSIEDGLDQSDHEGFAKLTQTLGDRVQIVGDDLFCTNPKLTQQGVDKKLANSVLVKVNQIGTLTETLRTAKIAQHAGWTYVISHRSGETEDTTIADLAVGTNAGQIKTGSMSRSERVAKYNRLLEIEMELGKSNAVFLGLSALKNVSVQLLEKTQNQKLIGPEDDMDATEKVDVDSLSLLNDQLDSYDHSQEHQPDPSQSVDQQFDDPQTSVDDEWVSVDDDQSSESFDDPSFSSDTQHFSQQDNETTVMLEPEQVLDQSDDQQEEDSKGKKGTKKKSSSKVSKKSVAKKASAKKKSAKKSNKSV